MKIKILHLLDGAKKATGTAVIIDVFRAFTTACYIAANGAEKIIPVGKVEEAIALRIKYPEIILVGERNDKMVPGFNFGNSPTHIAAKNFGGKIVAHTTSAGTQGLVHATKAKEVITGSFVNAKAIARYIKMNDRQDISLVCMGYATKHPTEEDTYCAEYIRDILLQQATNFEQIKAFVRTTSAKRFFAPENQEFSPKTDFDLCMQPNQFNFVLKYKEDSEGEYFLDKINDI